MARKKRLHYLISLPVAEGLYAHAYLITTNEADQERATSQMMNALEKVGVRILIPIFMSTELDEIGQAVVEKFVTDTSPDGGELLRNAKNLHLSVWCSPEADTPELLALH